MNKKILIGIILVILLVCCGLYATFGSVIKQQDYGSNEKSVIIDSDNLEVLEKNVINQSENFENKLFTTNQSDVNAILVENNATSDIKNSIINKTGDSSTDGDSNDFYGTNSAILVKKGSVANIDNCNIITNSKGSNAIFVTNADNNENQQEDDITSKQNNMQEQKDNNMNSQPPESPEKESNNNENIPNENQQPEKPDNSKNMNSNENYYEGGATANIENVEINTYKDKSRGLDATYGGVINADNVIINTRGDSCAAVATDRGEGKVTVKNSVLNTGVDNCSGRGSPCIYSTGNISVSDSKGTAYVSQIGCIEGKNSITIDNSELTAFGCGNREDNGAFVDLGGFFIYQSMSGDADVGTATLNASNSVFSIDKSSEFYELVPMFHVTNTNAIINLNNCECNFGSDVLLNVSGQNQWGNTGENGGNLEFNINDEDLNGNIFIDEISSLSLNMKKSDFTGTINANDSYGNTNVTISEDSSWTLTGDSHVTSLNNMGNIDYGSYTLYVDGEAYTSSNPF